MLQRLAKRFLNIGQREASVPNGSVLYKLLYTDMFVVYCESCRSQKFELLLIFRGQFYVGSLILK